jgi:hypothetical protein
VTSVGGCGEGVMGPFLAGQSSHSERRVRPISAARMASRSTRNRLRRQLEPVLDVEAPPSEPVGMGTLGTRVPQYALGADRPLAPIPHRPSPSAYVGGLIGLWVKGGSLIDSEQA